MHIENSLNDEMKEHVALYYIFLQIKNNIFAKEKLICENIF